MSLLLATISVIAIWWIGTGIVLYLQQRLTLKPRPLAVSLSVLAMTSLVVMLTTSQTLTTTSIYLGFLAAIVLWGCLELSYYRGLITGMHKRRCPDHCNSVTRFKLALGISIWHELSIVFVGMVLMLLLWHEPNTVGLRTFLVLWIMRWSAKINLFLGVPNFNTDWFPKNMAYAHTYIRRSRVSWFFPLSVTTASFVAWQWLPSQDQSSANTILASTLPAILLILAVLEHLFMALPVSDQKLWNRIFARPETNNSSGTIISEGYRHTRLGELPTQSLPNSLEPVSVSIVRVKNRMNECVKSPNHKPMAS